MPISYVVDKERNVVLVTWKGDVTADDYRVHLSKMLDDPDALSAGRSLTDLREANVLLSGAELDAIAEAEADRRLAGRQWKTAILVSSNFHYGLARQVTVLSQSESTDRVFLDYAGALAWLLGEKPA